MAELTNEIREAVRERYAAAAQAAADQAGAGCCAPGPPTASPADRTGVFGGALYEQADGEGIPQAAIEASLGCGVPTAVADLRAGETVLDLGSGAGADVLISARRVGPTGRAIGLDMTDEMLALARANAAAAGVGNAEFLKGYLEEIPLPDASVEVTDLAGDGEHYAARVVSATFRGKSLVQQHQLVYAALKGRMGGVLHALALQTSAE